DPCFMTVGLPDDSQGRISNWAAPLLPELIDAATVVACGPGLGQSDELVEIVAWMFEGLPRPVVFDADALNALAKRPAVLEKAAGPRILTPHPGEFARLTGSEAAPAEDEREQLAREFAARTRSVVVLKGHRTVITDGDRVSVNTTGNPGMATGGTGDVLTG